MDQPGGRQRAAFSGFCCDRLVGVFIGSGRLLTMTIDTAPQRVRPQDASERGRRADMIWLPGGTFRMGSDKHYGEEAPVHRVTVEAFWIDRTPVTNREFRE